MNIQHYIDYPKSYRCHVAVIKEDDGFSAIVLNLPGVGSCGSTPEEAFANVREAAKAAIESYLEDQQEIPWTDQYDVPEAVIKTIMVNLDDVL